MQNMGQQKCGIRTKAYFMLLSFRVDVEANSVDYREDATTLIWCTIHPVYSNPADLAPEMQRSQCMSVCVCMFWGNSIKHLTAVKSIFRQCTFD